MNWRVTERRSFEDRTIKRTVGGTMTGADHKTRDTITHLLRRLVLTSIAIGAVMGIAVLLGAEIGATGAKVIGTSFAVTGSALLAMPAAAARERRQLGRLPDLGISAAVAGFGWLIAGLWAEFEGSSWMWKMPATLIATATAVAIVALLAFSKLAPSHRWVLMAARTAVAVVAVMIVIGVWAEPGSDTYWRIFGILAVLLAALLAAIPILHRSTHSDSRLAKYCPLCATANEVPAGTVAQCPSCEQRYRVIA
jgi:hypothetical protein